MAAILFTLLSLATTRQTHIIDLEGWEHASNTDVSWGTKPVDIGTPADVLLLAFNLPALIALLPLSPLAYWVDSEMVLRTAWGLATVGQWFSSLMVMLRHRKQQHDTGTTVAETGFS